MAFDPEFMSYVAYQLYGGGTDPSYNRYRNNCRYGFDSGLDYYDLETLAGEFARKKKQLDEKIERTIIVEIRK